MINTEINLVNNIDNLENGIKLIKEESTNGSDGNSTGLKGFDMKDPRGSQVPQRHDVAAQEKQICRWISTKPKEKIDAIINDGV